MSAIIVHKPLDIENAYCDHTTPEQQKLIKELLSKAFICCYMVDGRAIAVPKPFTKLLGDLFEKHYKEFSYVVVHAMIEYLLYRTNRMSGPGVETTLQLHKFATILGVKYLQDYAEIVMMDKAKDPKWRIALLDYADTPARYKADCLSIWLDEYVQFALAEKAHGLLTSKRRCGCYFESDNSECPYGQDSMLTGCRTSDIVHAALMQFIRKL